MSTGVFSVRDLTVRFLPQGRYRPAVSGVGFDLEPGTVTGLVGESGCGKSALGLALLGLLPEHQARVSARSARLGQRELVEFPGGRIRPQLGRDLAMIFQEPATALDPVFTVGWQLAQVIARRHGLGRRAAVQAACEALSEVGFPDPQHVCRAYPMELSGGMRQLVMIAMAASVRPSVLVADEPTTALDASTRALVLDRLTRLAEEQACAILLVSHDLGVISACASRVMVMYCGQVVEDAVYADFFRRPGHPYSAGLLAAVPRLDGAAHRPRAIPGQVPALDQQIPGCPFAPRCSRADAACVETAPSLCDRGNARLSCHHPL